MVPPRVSLGKEWTSCNSTQWKFPKYTLIVTKIPIIFLFIFHKDSSVFCILGHRILPCNSSFCSPKFAIIQRVAEYLNYLAKLWLSLFSITSIVSILKSWGSKGIHFNCQINHWPQHMASSIRTVNLHTVHFLWSGPEND